MRSLPAGTGDRGAHGMSVRDPWALLELDRSVDDAAIKAAYRRLAKIYHPDRNSDDEEAAGRFQEIARAYEAIRDESARARWLVEHESPSAFDDNGFPPFPESDLTASQRQETQRIEHEVTIDFRAAFAGSLVEVMLEVEDVCSVCGGSGAAPGTSPRPCELCGATGRHQIAGLRANRCQGCNGRKYVIEHPCRHCESGVVRETRGFPLQIPAGVSDGFQLSVAGPQRARFGRTDLLVTVRVEDSPVFKRTESDPADLMIEVPISYAEACFGSKVKIPTPSRTIAITIPPATASGELFKVSGEGMPRLGAASEVRGDLYARINVDVPAQLSGPQRKLVKQLADLDPPNLRYEALFAKLG